MNSLCFGKKVKKYSFRFYHWSIILTNTNFNVSQLTDKWGKTYFEVTSLYVLLKLEIYAWAIHPNIQMERLHTSPFLCQTQKSGLTTLCSVPNKEISNVLVYDLFVCCEPKLDIPVILLLCLTGGCLIEFEGKWLILKILQYIFPIRSHSKLECILRFCFTLLTTFCCFWIMEHWSKFLASVKAAIPNSHI